MAQACEAYIQSNVAAAGTWGMQTDQPGYPTSTDMDNAGLFAMKRICIERGLEWDKDQQMCKYTKSQCTVDSKGTCDKGLEDPLGAGKFSSCSKVPVGTQGKCCLKRPPSDAWGDVAFGAATMGSGALLAGLATGATIPPNHFKNMSYTTFNNHKHNVFGYTKDNIADVQVNVDHGTCGMLGGRWDSVKLKCNLKPNYQQASQHTCVVERVGKPSGKSGKKSREAWTAAETEKAEAACKKIKGTFTPANGCVITYKTPSLKQLKTNPLLIESNVAHCTKLKGFYQARNVVYKEQHGKQCIIGMPYENVRKWCEIPSSRLHPNGKPVKGFYDVPPFRYNTNYKGKAFDKDGKWNRSDWLCAATKSYCDKHEMDFQSNPLASNAGCYEPVGEEWAEFIFGKTMVRNFKRDIVENVRDAYTNCGGGPHANVGNELKGIGCGAAAAVGGTAEFVGDTAKDVGKSVVKVGEDVGGLIGKAGNAIGKWFG